jgi:hypothetical protein
MFGFPPILDGNAGIKFTNNADSGFPKPGIREIFYSVRDGDWLNPTTWQTASGRVGLLPTANDDVYVRHTIGGSFVFTINNLFITPTGTLNGSNGGLCTPLVINGGIFSYGVYNYGPNSTSLCGGALELRGTNNYIDKTKQTATHIRYTGPTSQPIIDANYSLLVVGSANSAGEKYLTCDLTIGGLDITNINSTLPTWLNFKNFNFTCNGTFTTVNSGISIHSEGNQNLVFKGLARISSGIYCLNAPTIEFQNGAEIGTGANAPRWVTPYGTVNSYLGTGLLRFTTNSQSISGGFVQLTLDNTIEISDNITLTTTYTPSASLTLTNTINGLGANSRLRQGLNSTLNFGTATAATTAMSTGLFDFTTNANTIGYTGNYSATIPSYFTNFHSLTISGTGTKTLGVNTTLNGNLAVSTGGSFEMSTFDLTVTGTTTIGSGNTTFSKNGAGNITFIGQLLATSFQPVISFTGNPNIEFRNGFNINTPTANLTTGTGTWSFTTNTQTLTLGSNQYNFNAAFSIVGNITVTYANSTGTLISNSTINGTLAGSTFINNGLLWLNNSTLPMATGVFTNSTTTGQLGYIFNGNFTIPLTTFNSLYISGTGTKILSGNTTLNGTLLLNTNYGTGTLELSTFDLTVNGTGTSLNAGATFSKNGAGNIVFAGLFQNSGGSAALNLSGNPNVEFRNGFAITAGSLTSGTGQWSFTTNDQAITLSTNPFTLNCSVLISGTNRIVTYTTTGGIITLVGLLNGSTSTSTFRMGSGTPTFNYQNTTQPMATGVLDTSTNLNTFIYGAGNQQVKGGTPQQYRNLTLNGGGNKTLQGNINVQNTYTVTAPAALVLNGFTKTPP